MLFQYPDCYVVKVLNKYEIVDLLMLKIMSINLIAILIVSIFATCVVVSPAYAKTNTAKVNCRNVAVALIDMYFGASSDVLLNIS